MSIELTNLKLQYQGIKKEIDAAVQRVLTGAEFILGEELEEFEKELADYCGAKYAVGVASGTDALVIALASLGIGKGDAIITTPFTFIATAEAIVRVGAEPIFVDVHPQTLNIDPLKIEGCLKKARQNIKAVFPVHLYGQMADMPRIMEIAQRYNLKVVEDAAQAMGAKAGAIGDARCLSFFPTKNLGAYGDGGAIITESSEVARRAKALRNHGSLNKYHYSVSGFNSRLDNLQAAILRVKLRHLDEWVKRRRANAAYYNQLLEDSDLILPTIDKTSVFNYYTIRVRPVKSPDTSVGEAAKPLFNKVENNQRDRLQKALREEGVATAIYYPLSLHLQEVYRDLGYKQGDFPVAEQAQEEVLSLPMYAELKKEEIERISKIIKQVTNHQKTTMVRKG